MELWQWFCYVVNVGIFAFDNSSWCHTDNQNISFLVLGERQTKDINNSVGPAETKLLLPLVKQRKICFWVCMTTVLIVICM